jgi:hypothetical protein
LAFSRVSTDDTAYGASLDGGTAGPQFASWPVKGRHARP